MVISYSFWLYPLLVWTIIWSAIGWWYSARNNQIIWFLLFFINTLGILPLIYFIWFRKDKTSAVLDKKRVGRKGTRVKRKKR